MDKKGSFLVYGIIIGLLFVIFLLWEQKGQLKTDLADKLRDAFAPQITEIETASKGTDFDHFRNLFHHSQTKQFLCVLLKSGIFVSEIRKRQYQESFDSKVRGWRIPWKQEFKNGKLVWEWGFVFRMEGGRDTKPFATCLVYTYSDEPEKVLELNYLGLDHGLPTIEESKKAIIAALKK